MARPSAGQSPALGYSPRRDGTATGASTLIRIQEVCTNGRIEGKRR